MVTSDAEICNLALINIGASTILTLDQANSKAAKLCNVVYVPCRDEVLRSHPWNFAVERVTLSPEVTAPAFEYSYKFVLPSDCLRTLAATEDGIPIRKYKREGNGILADTSAIDLKYIKRVTDVALFDDLFTNALVCRIALKVSYAMTEVAALRDSLKDEYKTALRKARFVDGVEDPSEEFIDDSWFNARSSGPSSGLENT